MTVTRGSAAIRPSQLSQTVIEYSACVSLDNSFRSQLLDIHIRQTGITTKYKHIANLIQSINRKLFFLQRGELILREKYSFGVFQLIKPMVLNRVVNDLREITNVLLRTIVVALAERSVSYDEKCGAIGIPSLLQQCSRGLLRASAHGQSFARNGPSKPL